MNANENLDKTLFTYYTVGAVKNETLFFINLDLEKGSQNIAFLEVP